MCFEFGAQLRVGRRRVAQAFEKRFEIKAGAAAKDRHTTARLDVRHRLAAPADELRRVERLVKSTTSIK